MNSLTPFLSNLAQTCKTDNSIREDGKTLSFFNRIVDLFYKKTKYNHFHSTCQKLAEASLDGSIKNLSIDDQMDILGRIRQIQKKLKKEDVKQECDRYIQQLEEIILKDKDLTVDVLTSIFSQLEKSSLLQNHQKRDQDIRKIDALLDYYEKDLNCMGSVGIIADSWIKFYQDKLNALPTKEILLLKQTHDILKAKLLNRQAKLLEAGKGNPRDFKNYLYLFFAFFNTQIYKASNQQPENENEIKSAVANLKDIPNKIAIIKKELEKHASDQQFIQDSLQTINQTLDQTLFSYRLSLTEKQKEHLILFQELFSIVNQYLPLITDQKLISDLKIKFANLPTSIDHFAFNNLYLSEKEQVNILVKNLQRQEDKVVTTLVESLKTQSPPRSDISRLAKLVSVRSNLSKDNLTNLRQALAEKLKEQAPKNWEDYREVLDCLKNFFLSQNPGRENLISSLTRVNKCKVFFEKQVGLEENMILIPRWYHATNLKGMVGILNSGGVQVRHEKMFSGAWLSSLREEEFGPYVLSFNNRIIPLDPNAFIGFQYADRRWRGLQKAIPLNTGQNNAPNLALLGVPTKVDKMAQKADKLQLIQILKARGFPDPKALSAYQVDFMQKEVAQILGAPNLPDRWWGRART